MKRLLAVLRWPLWTIRPPHGRHRAVLEDPRPDWTVAELAALPHVRNPALRRPVVNPQEEADRAERGGVS